MGSRNHEKVSIGGYIPKILKKEVQEIAHLERRTLSQIVEFFLEEGVKRTKVEEIQLDKNKIPNKTPIRRKSCKDEI